MIKNIIFDYGNTVCEFIPKNIIKSFGVGDTDDILLLEKIVFDRKYWDALDSGELSQKDFKNRVKENLPKRLHGVTDEICDNWYKNLPIIEGMDKTVKELKKEGYKIYLLSNISKLFAENKDKIKILSYFDGFVFSSTCGCVKPSKEIFYHLLEKYGLQAGECAFFDDLPKNVQSANECKINAFLFKGDFKDVKNFINSINNK